MFQHREEYQIYSKIGCFYCEKAKELLTKNDLFYTEIACDSFLTTQQNKQEFLQRMRSKAKMEVSTFPMIFQNEVYIGGFVDLKAHLQALWF